MIVSCSNPECQTTAGCKCQKGFGVNFTWGHVKDLPKAKEMEALRAENAELRTALANARKEALEEAARYHDDESAKHDACGYESQHHEMMTREHRRFAAAIRALEGGT